MAATKPTSEVEICNLALDHLNQKPIADINSPSNSTAEICARHYPQARRALLRSHLWNFASKRAALPEASVDIAFGFESAFALPNDFLRLAGIGNENEGLMHDDSGRLLIRYVYDKVTVASYDPLFIEVLALELAIVMSNKFTIGDAEKAALREDLAKKLSLAKSIDGQERPPRVVSRSKWLTARRGRRSGSVSGYGSPWVTFGDGVRSPVSYQVEDGYILTGAPV